MLLRRIYVGQKYPHIYTLSISIGKNQSIKVRGALYIPSYEYNYKVIIGYDTILQEYYITDRRKCDNTKKITSMSSTKVTHESQRKTREPSRGPEKIGLQTDLPLIHTRPVRHSDQQEVHLGPRSKI